MKADFSEIGNDKFAQLVKTAIALAFCPLERLQNDPKNRPTGLSILEDLAKKQKPKYRKFAKGFVKYIKTNWLDENGNFPPATWNFYLFHGATSNNFNEGVNRKLKHDVIGVNPNPYKAARSIKKLLTTVQTEVEARDAGNGDKWKPDQKYVTLKNRRKKLMVRLHNNGISLESYLLSVGENTMHLDRRIIKNSPVVMVDKDVSEKELEHPEESESILPDLSQVSCDDNKKSFSGSVLREKRKAQHYADCLGQNIETEQQEKEIKQTQEKNADEELTLAEGWILAKDILIEYKMKRSPSQMETEGDGNCYIHALKDQMSYDSNLENFADLDTNALRKMICRKLDKLMESDPLMFPKCIKIRNRGRFNDEKEGTPEEWKTRMGTNKCHADEIFFRLSSECIKREIVLYLVGAGFSTRIYRPTMSSIPANSDPIHMLYFSETKFGVGHFQSIRPVDHLESVNLNFTPDVDNKTRNTTENTPTGPCFPPRFQRHTHSWTEQNNNTASTIDETILLTTPIANSTEIDSFGITLAWAKLETKNIDCFKSCEIFENFFEFGKHADTHGIIKRVEMEKECPDFLRSISKLHFEINRDPKTKIITLEDRSKGGTFVNGNLVGLENTVNLKDGSLISVSIKNKPAFKFFILDIETKTKNKYKDFLDSTLHSKDESDETIPCSRKSRTNCRNDSTTRFTRSKSHANTRDSNESNTRETRSSKRSMKSRSCSNNTRSSSNKRAKTETNLRKSKRARN